MQGETFAGALHCPRCDAAYDEGDNFCRRCGANLNGSNLPAVRDSYEVALPWKGQSMPALVRGAAVVAAGTLTEMLLRRLVSRAFRPKRVRWPVQRPAEAVTAAPAPSDDSMPADTHVVSETFILRRVRLRR